jgi:SAM-dependent methyltransferase
LKSTDKHWEDWGKNAPYYGVVTDEKFRNPDSAALDAFFASGSEHIDSVLKTIRGFLPQFAPSRSLDFGCGTGRLVVALSKLSPVVGVDISPSMISEARKNADSRGVGTNADFVLSDDGLTKVTGDFDLIHSSIVLQHIPVVRGMRIAHQLLARLRPNGVAALHFTYGRTASPARKVASWVRSRVMPIHYAINIATGQSGAPMQMNAYDIGALFALFQDHACVIHNVELTDHGGTQGAMFFLRRT